MKLFVDKKVEIWRREYIDVNAETEQEAVQKYLNGDYEIYDTDFIYETESPIEPTDYPTEELYSRDNYECLWTNLKKK